MRKLQAAAVYALCSICAGVALMVLIGIIGAIVVRGLSAVRWQFLTEQMSAAGADGGILYNILGTVILLATAGALAAPLATGIALTHSYYLPAGRARQVLSLLLYVLNGVPSILFGLFGLIVFVKFLGWGKSWLAGGMLLGFMILPTVTVALIEKIKALPPRYIEAAAGLGLTPSQIVRSVVLPQSAGGLLTGLMLGLARAAGETAPVMFTATIFAGATLPRGVIESPVLSLPYHIFVLAQDSFNPGVAARVWGTAVVLLGLVFLLSAVALPLRLRIREEAQP